MESIHQLLVAIVEQSVNFNHKETLCSHSVANFNYRGTLCSHRVANLVTRTVANERVQQNGLLVSLCERERERSRDRVRMDACLSAMILSLWATVLRSKSLIESQSGL